MQGIEEIQAAILEANQKTRDAIAAFNQAHSCIEESEKMLATASHGSSQEDIHGAIGALREVQDLMRYLTATAETSIERAETYAGRL